MHQLNIFSERNGIKDEILPVLPGSVFHASEEWPLFFSKFPGTPGIRIWFEIELSDVDLSSQELKNQITTLGEHGFCREYKDCRGVVSVYLQLINTEGAIETMAGDIPGSVANLPRGPKGDDWDRIWVPYGFRTTFAELRNQRWTINKRIRLLVDAAQALDVDVSVDFYEAHITVDASGDSAWRRFETVCDTLGIKAIRIELPKGVQPSQFITASIHRGSLDKVRTEAFELARLINGEELPVKRIKIEATTRNTLVPTTDEEARKKPEDNYFEFHAKITVDENSNLAGLRNLCEKHNAHLSRNASNTRKNRKHQRFVTMRFYRLGLKSSNLHFERLLDDLRDKDFEISNLLKEYTVFDTNTNLDKGWFGNRFPENSTTREIDALGLIT
uniref:Ham1 family protein n=1 Tax=Candidatus Kentrum sp. MB TaxID=2138164 RepID=A0A450XGI3_9GAMM|nr:MAG: Ham1 family protein [Candidatus Kentron sp. MB]VFK28410.1 MAG: Ham1 family protein [Candidatus Kentron sp. MB]VFK74243.1 MAG: Ham1 family protein [Candidatus Kentron sp. MB]